MLGMDTGFVLGIILTFRMHMGFLLVILSMVPANVLMWDACPSGLAV